MYKYLVLGLLAVGFESAPAKAANCPANPYTLTNGNNADASQVMVNFNNILNCANANLAPLANPHFTGNVGIGTATPNSPLVINGSVQNVLTVESSSPDSQIALQNTTASGKTWKIGTAGTGSGAALGSLYIQDAASGQIYFSILSAGNVGVATLSQTLAFQVNGTAGGTSAWQVVSDERLKRDISPLTGALAVIEHLHGVSYYWRDKGQRDVGRMLELPLGEREVGFLAQDVDKVLPEAVSYSTSGDGLYRLKEDNIIPVLVEAIKEQQREIEALEARLAAHSHR